MIIIKEIAIISAGKMPIPSVLGGGTETLVTHLINENELHGLLNITVYSQFNEEASIISKLFKNCKVKYFNCDFLNYKIYDLFWRGLRKLTFHRSFLRSIFIKKCIKDIVRNEFDYIIVEGNHFQVLQLKSKLKNKLILHMHTDMLNKYTDNGNKIINSCYKILAISNYCKNQIASININLIDRIVVFKNAIDTKRYNKILYLDFRDKFRKDNNILDNDKLIIFCGRLDESKGIKELLIAFRDLNCKKTKLLIVGSYWFSDNKTTKYIEELKLLAEPIKEQVIFTGYIPQDILPQYYASADIAVCPSLCNEAAGLVIIEALATGIPVIVTKKGGIPEYAHSSSCIILDVDENIIYSLKKALSDLVYNDSLYLEKQKNAYEIGQCYNKESYYKNFVEILSD